VDLEAPADAWYVWVGVALVSIAAMGVALSLPAQPPPDADRMAGAVDRVAASEHGGSVAFDHEAAKIRIGAEQIAARNEGGTARATVAFARLVHVRAVSERHHDALADVLAGGPVDSEAREALRAVTADFDTTTGEWYPARGEFRARAVTVDGERIVLVDA
jgi:hypothetical protein